MTDLAELIPGAVYERTDYGAPATPGGGQRDRSQVVGMTVHWTTGRALGRPNTLDWVASIYRYHAQTLGWADIGYAYLVDKHGNVFVGRGRFRSLAHATGYNSTWLGVAYLGGHDDDITPQAKAAFIGLRQWLREDGGMLRMSRVNGHRDLGSTFCPGNRLHRWVHRGMPAPDLEEDIMATLDNDDIEAIAEATADKVWSTLIQHGGMDSMRASTLLSRLQGGGIDDVLARLDATRSGAVSATEVVDEIVDRLDR